VVEHLAHADECHVFLSPGLGRLIV